MLCPFLSIIFNERLVPLIVHWESLFIISAHLDPYTQIMPLKRPTITSNVIFLCQRSPSLSTFLACLCALTVLARRWDGRDGDGGRADGVILSNSVPVTTTSRQAWDFILRSCWVHNDNMHPTSNTCQCPTWWINNYSNYSRMMA